MRCIVSTGKDGAVFVTHPTTETMTFLTHGGAPDGYFRRVDRDEQIERMVGRGIRQVVAVKWITVLFTGGLTDAEAYELIRDRDTHADWSGKELWNRSEIPADRWFRDAWKRSPNGGPIYVNLDRAKPIQFRRIRSAIEDENKRRQNELDLFDALFECDLPALRERIRSVDDERALRAIWPDGLS
jgi:hypothetical protein